MRRRKLFNEKKIQNPQFASFNFENNIMFDVKLLQNYRPTASKIKPQEVVRSTYE